MYPKVDSAGDYILGLAPGRIFLSFGQGSSAKVLAGSGNDTFTIAGTTFVTPISIDGGGGTNILDYSTTSGPAGVYVNLRTSEASGLAGIARIQNVTGSPLSCAASKSACAYVRAISSMDGLD